MSTVELFASPDQQRERLNDVRLRLVDAIAVLKPSPPEDDDIEAHVSTALRELTVAQRELRLLLHIRRLEETGLSEQIAELEANLANGWEPPSEPVDDVVAELKSEFGLD